MTTNRHPADRLAEIRSEIKQLEAEEEKLRVYLLEHPDDRIGVEYCASVGDYQRKRVDMKGLAAEIGHSLLARFTQFSLCRTVRLHPVPERAAEAHSDA